MAERNLRLANIPEVFLLKYLGEEGEKGNDVSGNIYLCNLFPLISVSDLNLRIANPSAHDTEPQKIELYL